MQVAEHFRGYICACRPETMKKSLRERHDGISTSYCAFMSFAFSSHWLTHWVTTAQNWVTFSNVFPSSQDFSKTLHMGVPWRWGLCWLRVRWFSYIWYIFFIHLFFGSANHDRWFAVENVWEKPSSSQREQVVWIVVLKPSVNGAGCNESQTGPGSAEGFHWALSQAN